VRCAIPACDHRRSELARNDRSGDPPQLAAPRPQVRAVNCGALPETSSRGISVSQGAFTGATETPGIARGRRCGTLFSMSRQPPSMCKTLLRFLQEQNSPSGGKHSDQVHVRLVWQPLRPHRRVTKDVREDFSTGLKSSPAPAALRNAVTHSPAGGALHPPSRTQVWQPTAKVDPEAARGGVRLSRPATSASCETSSRRP